MTNRLTERQKKFKKDFEKFCQAEIASRASEIDDKGKIPADVWKKLVDSGYLQFFHPVDRGGKGLDPVSVGIAMETLGGACASTAWTASISSNVCGRMLGDLGREPHHDDWFRSVIQGDQLAAVAIVETVGSDFSTYLTKLSKKDGKFFLNGTKATVTNALNAGVCLVYCLVDGYEDQSAIVVLDTSQPGFRTTELVRTSVRGMGWGDIEFQNVEINESDVLATGTQLEIISQILDYIDWGLLFQASCSLGIASAALNSTVDFHRDRPFYSKPMLNKQNIHGQIAEMHASLLAGQLLSYEALIKKTKRTDDAGLLCRKAKIFATEVSVQINVNAMRLHGSHGVRKPLDMERYMRDSYANFYAGHSSDFMRETYACAKLGLSPFENPDLSWIAEGGFKVVGEKL